MQIVEKLKFLPTDAGFVDVEREIVFTAMRDTESLRLLMSTMVTILGVCGPDLNEFFDEFRRERRKELAEAFHVRDEAS